MIQPTHTQKHLYYAYLVISKENINTEDHYSGIVFCGGLMIGNAVGWGVLRSVPKAGLGLLLA